MTQSDATVKGARDRQIKKQCDEVCKLKETVKSRQRVNKRDR